MTYTINIQQGWWERICFSWHLCSRQRPVVQPVTPGLMRKPRAASSRAKAFRSGVWPLKYSCSPAQGTKIQEQRAQGETAQRKWERQLLSQVTWVSKSLKLGSM